MRIAHLRLGILLVPVVASLHVAAESRACILSGVQLEEGWWRPGISATTVLPARS